MRKVLIVGVVVVAGMAGAYLAGYLPESRQRTAAETRLAALETELSSAEARLRVGELLGQVLALEELASRQDYGQARELSSPFFDAVRTESVRVVEEPLRSGLSEVLSRRDEVTAALANGNPAVTTMLSEVERRLREALGYPVPARPANAPETAGSGQGDTGGRESNSQTSPASARMD